MNRRLTGSDLHVKLSHSPHCGERIEEVEASGWGDQWAAQQSSSQMCWLTLGVEMMGIKRRSKDPGEMWEIKCIGPGVRVLCFLIELFLIRLYTFVSLSSCT